MAGWTQHTGRAAVLELENIDTDQLIPARFMSVPRSEGYADYLLYDLRRDNSGKLLPAFPLNEYGDCTVLVAGQNFGTGSSREAAVYALVDYGFRVVIAPSFGDIFAGNAVNNGLLPVRVSEPNLSSLKEALTRNHAVLSVSVEDQTVTLGDLAVSFEISQACKQKIQNWWDDIDLTLQQASEIDAFCATYRTRRTWAWPDASQ